MKNTAILISAVAFTAISAENVWADLNKGLVAHYPFNGNAQDASGNKHHGTVHGATLVKDRFGNANSAYRFNGRQSITVDKMPTMGSFTFVGWVNWDSIKGLRPFIDNTTTTVRFEMLDNKLSLSDKLSDALPVKPGTWFFIAATYNAQLRTITHFFNGKPVGTVRAAIPNPRGKFYLGEGPTGAHEYLKGAIDDVGIYRRALSKAEINQLYRDSKAPKPSEAPKSLCKLNVTAKMQEKQLEPDDDAIYRITVTQTASCCLARNVVAKLALTGKHKGLTLGPNSLKFGNLGPKQSAQKNAAVKTRKATPGKEASLSMDFDYQCVYAFPDKAHKDFVIEVVLD